mmetsp:Transcript_45163/g.123893  ORF Transcript_45163/g.123893 Transcript_45163/m.123893 type:complete len:1147 (-) Transcript_45163:440-3880(-)
MSKVTPTDGRRDRPRELISLFDERLEERYIAGRQSLKHSAPGFVHAFFATLVCAGLVAGVVGLQPGVCGVRQGGVNRSMNLSCGVPLLAASIVHMLGTAACWLWYAVGGGLRGRGDGAARAWEAQAIATVVSVQVFLVVGLTTFVGAFSTAGEFASNDDDVVDERMLVQNHVSSFNTAYIMGCAMMAAGFYFVTYKCVQMMVGSMFVLQFASLTVFVIDGSRSMGGIALDLATTSIYCYCVVYGAHLLDGVDRKSFLLSKRLSSMRSGEPGSSSADALVGHDDQMLRVLLVPGQEANNGLSLALPKDAGTKVSAKSPRKGSSSTGKVVMVRGNTKVNDCSPSSDASPAQNPLEGLSPLASVAACSPPSYRSRRFLNKSKSKLSLNSNYFEDTAEPASGSTPGNSERRSEPSDNGSYESGSGGMRERIPSTATMSINETPSVCGSTNASWNGDAFQNHPLSEWNTDEVKDKLVKLDVIGRGNSSTVSMAVDATTGQVMALKTMPMTGGVQAMLQQELMALDSNQKGSSYMVNYHGAFVSDEDNKASLMVEFMANGDLESWVEAKHELPEEFLAVVAYQVCKALASLNEKKRMHRDVKPGNVLISSTGQVKLSDFGMCADVKGATDTGCDMNIRPNAGVGFARGSTILSRQERHSETLKDFVGTYRYMSPERLTADEYSYSADVWALGLTLATCVLGECPFSKDCSFWQLLQNSELPETEVMKREDLSTDLRDFITTCLKKDPNERPEAKDMLQHPFVKKREDWTTEAWSRISKPCMVARDQKYTQSKLSAYVAQIDRRRRTLHGRGLVASKAIKSDLEASERFASELGIKRSALDEVFALDSGDLSTSVILAMQARTSSNVPMRRSMGSAQMSAMVAHNTEHSGSSSSVSMQQRRASRNTYDADSLPKRLWLPNDVPSMASKSPGAGLWNVPPDLMTKMPGSDMGLNDQGSEKVAEELSDIPSFRREKSAKSIANMGLKNAVTATATSTESSGEGDSLGCDLDDETVPGLHVPRLSEAESLSAESDTYDTFNAVGRALSELDECDESSSRRRLSDGRSSGMGSSRLQLSSSRRRSSGAFSEVSSSVGDFGDVARLSEVNSICGEEGDAGGRLSSVGQLLKEQGIRQQDMSSDAEEKSGSPREAMGLW